MLSLDLTKRGPQFAANHLGDLQQDAAVFGQREQTEPLAIVHRDHFQRPRQNSPQARSQTFRFNSWRRRKTKCGWSEV